MESLVTRFREIILEKKLIESNLSLIYWDLETTAPIKGKKLISDIVGYLSEKSYNLTTSEEFIDIANELFINRESLDEITKRELELAMEDIEKLKKILPKDYKDYSELTTMTQVLWEEAKNKSDFSIVEDNLKKIFDYNIKFAKARLKNEDNLYDVILDDYEKGITCKKLDILFSDLKVQIVPLLKEIQLKQKQIDSDKTYDFVYKNASIENQKKLNMFIAQYLGFDFEKGILSTSEHPFTLDASSNDVRITTRYLENDPFSSLFSTIHEVGHAIYEQQVSDKFYDTLLSGGTSMGIHESQSRFYENILGRNINFWTPIYETLKEHYTFLNDISLEDFEKGINQVSPSLIRTDSDELTYSLHIMIRYELEKDLINGKIEVSDLPTLWRKKIKEYLGIEVPNDKEGVLQDVHWYSGLIGYFPSYALGNICSAQFFNVLNKDLDFDKILLEKKLSIIKKWFGDKIHQYGKLKIPVDLIKEVTGEEINTQYYVHYLREKYSKIYNL